MKLGLLLVFLLGIISWYFFVYLQPEPDIVKTDSALRMKIDECEGITEQAAAHLVAVVEFQKLEIIGRKARVFKQCMQDRGYIENTQWLAYSQPVAEKISQEANDVSVGEALENLRRANMVASEGEKARPPYWVKQAQSQTP